MNFVLRYSVKVQRDKGPMWIGADIYGTSDDLQRMIDGFITDGLRKETIKDVQVLKQEPQPWVDAGFVIPSPEAIPAPTAIPEMKTIPVTWEKGVPAPMLNKAWQFENPSK